MTSNRKFAIALLVCCFCAFAWAQESTSNDKSTTGNSELQRATETVQNIASAAPDRGVPKTVLEGAKCVAVIPKLIKGAFIVGGEHGDGVATCRTTGNVWSAPAPFSVSGISWGPQIGGKSTDLLMFIMNDQGMNDLISGHIKVGADVSAAAGPAGRQASAEAGWKARILTDPNSKAAFVGASLNGAELNQDHKLTKELFGSDVPFAEILQGKAQAKSTDARDFVNAVQN